MNNQEAADSFAEKLKKATMKTNESKADKAKKHKKIV